MSSQHALITFAQIGNVCNQTLADHYVVHLQHHCKQLAQLHALLDAPWYDRLFLRKRIKELVSDTRQESDFLDKCREKIRWERIDEKVIDLVRFYEKADDKLSMSPLVAKRLAIK